MGKKLVCGVEGCEYTTDFKSNMTRHKAGIHDIGVIWKYCDVDGCEYKCKHKTHLNTHKANKHNIGVVWKYCDADGCEDKFKNESALKRHKANRHNIGVVWTKCDVDGCEYQCKEKGSLNTHKTNTHNIGVVWNKCDVDGCEYKCKFKGHLDTHKAHIHNIGVVWNKCDVDGCEYKSKQNCDLNRHRKICTGEFNGSSGELKIKTLLTDLQVNFKYNQTDSDLTQHCGKRLRLDFIVQVDDCKVIIEFNGKQHYEPMRFSSNVTIEQAQEKLKKQKHHDSLKELWCKDRGHPLIWIKYDQVGDIETLVKGAIQTPSLSPQNELSDVPRPV